MPAGSAHVCACCNTEYENRSIFLSFCQTIHIHFKYKTENKRKTTLAALFLEETHACRTFHRLYAKQFHTVIQYVSHTPCQKCRETIFLRKESFVYLTSLWQNVSCSVLENINTKKFMFSIKIYEKFTFSEENF